MVSFKRARDLLTTPENADAAAVPAAAPEPEEPQRLSFSEYPQTPRFTEYRTIVKSQEDLTAALLEGAAHIEVQDHIVYLAGQLTVPPFYILPALLSIRVRYKLCTLSFLASLCTPGVL